MKWLEKGRVLQLIVVGCTILLVLAIGCQWPTVPQPATEADAETVKDGVLNLANVGVGPRHGNWVADVVPCEAIWMAQFIASEKSPARAE